MLHVIGITKENKIEKQTQFTHSDWSRFKWVWVDLEEPSPEEINHVTNTFHLHPMTMEKHLQKLQRPKLETYNNHAFCITHILKEVNEEILKQELDFIVSENFMVTVHYSSTAALNQTWNMLITQSQIDSLTSYSVYYQILNHIVDAYFPLVENIEDKLETIED